MRDVSVVLCERELRLSNLDKPLYPSGFTKARVLDYYRRVASALLPHLAGRPLTLKRYPEGAAAPSFYEKSCPAHRPPWVRVAPVPSRHHHGAPVRYCLVNDLPSLIWVANLAALELHTPLARAPEVDRPTSVVFDLDPGAPADVVDCARVAVELRDLLARLGLESFPKSSGKKGLQLYAPLDPPARYDETKPFARALARLLEERRPDGVTSLMRKALRPGKVLVDWSQNDEHKTTVCAWSLRAGERPTVSAPLTWEEVERAARTGRGGHLLVEAEAALARLARDGDLFAPVLSLRQRLPDYRAGGSSAMPSG